jgi:hypothetical protein
MTPAALVNVLNRYMTVMSEAVRRHNGIIDKYLGDGIMAFWGPPFTDTEEHSGLACLAAPVANVIVARLLAEPANDHVLDHARPQRADGPLGGIGGHWGSSLELKVAGPSMLGIGCPIVTPYRSTSQRHCQKRADRDARSPARAGSFYAPKRTPDGGTRYWPSRVELRTNFLLAG